MSGRQIRRQIFIGGCSRSGTTLLGAMLGSHPDLICTPESHFKIDVLRSLTVTPAGIDLLAAAELINRHWRYRIWEMPLDVTAVPSATMGGSYDELMGYVVNRYAIQHKRPEATVWVDHTPENASYFNTLFAHFPQAKGIHIVRDGRAVAASIMPLDWGPNSIMKASRWWMRMVSFGLAAESAFGPRQVMRVKYEELVAEPERVLRPLCEFLEIPFQPEMTQANGFTPPRYTTNQHTLVGRQPDQKISSRWQQKLTRRQIEIFENQTRDYLTYLGYPLQYGLKAQGPTFSEVQKDKLIELWRGEIVNKIKWLRRSYPMWLSRDFYRQAGFRDKNN
jgi:hypothetical protein